MNKDILLKKNHLVIRQYEIYEGNNLYATIKQEFALFHAKINVNCIFGHFEINLNLMAMDYDINKNGQHFGSVHKKWLSSGDSYEIDITDSENARFICALVIAIDNCLDNENQS